MTEQESIDEMTRMLLDEGLITDEDICKPDSLSTESEDLEYDRLKETR